MLIIGVLLFILLILISRKFFSSYLNPLAFYSATWGGIYALYGLQLIKLPDLRWQTLLVMSLGHVAFVLGVTIPSMAVGGIRRKTFEFNVKRGDLAFLKRMLFILTCMYAMRIVVAVMDIVSLPGGFGVFFSNPWLIRGVFTSGAGVEGSLLRSFLLDIGGIGMCSLVLAGYLLAIVPKVSMLVLMTLVICISDAALYLQRASALRGISIFIISFLYTLVISSRHNSRRARSGPNFHRRTLLVMFAAMVFLASIFVANETILHKSANWEGRAIGSKLHSAALDKVYWYAVGPVAAFDRYLQWHGDDFKMGIWTFNLLVRPLASAGIVNEQDLKPAFGEPVSVLYATNIYTYFRPFYEDYGLLGIVIFPFGLGLFCSIAYLQLRKRFSIALLALNSILATTILMSFVHFMLADNRQSILLVIAIYFIERVPFRFLRRKHHFQQHRAVVRQVRKV